MVPLTSCRYSILVRCWFNSVCHDRINTSSKIMYIACTFKEIEILNISYIFSYLNICQAVSDPSVRPFFRGLGGGAWGWGSKPLPSVWSDCCTALTLGPLFLQGRSMEAGHSWTWLKKKLYKYIIILNKYC